MGGTERMTAAAYRAEVLDEESEDDFQARVVALAKRNRWKCYHTHDSRRSDPGWPDLVMARGGRLLLVECKRDVGKTSDAQDEWLDALNRVQNAVPDHVYVAVWRPAMWAQIERELCARVSS